MISDEDSKKLGKELTAQHPLAVFGMAESATSIPSGFGITSAVVTAVRTEGCVLRVTLCRGDLCEMIKPVYKFKTPLSSPDDLDKKIRSEVMNDVCAPNLTWLLTDPAALTIMVVCFLLTVGTYIGSDALTDALLKAPKLDKTISGIFGSSQNFSIAVVLSCWFAYVAHAFEASVGIYYCQTSLGLGLSQTLVWGFMIFLVGYPIFSRLQLLMAIQQGGHAKSH